MVMSATPTAIGYIRVSTTEQAVSGLGLAAQRTAIEAECARRGWTLVGIEADEGVSGSVAPGRRAGLSAAIEAVAAGRASVIVALRLDRIGRDAVDVLNLTRSVEVALVDFPADLTTVAGRMVLTVLAGAAELERGLIAARTKSAMAEAKKRGVRLGRPPTLPQDVRDRILSERANGSTLAAIAAGLTADGVPTAQGGQWRPATVAYIVKSAA